MVPGCIAEVWGTGNFDSLLAWIPDADKLYPEHMYRDDAVPEDILDWMDYRKHLIDVWKSCCKEFRQDFRRLERCYRDLDYAHTLYE
jgi:hypothetical protein